MMGGRTLGLRAWLNDVSLAALFVAAGLSAASAQTLLDPIIVVATKTEEKAVDSLAAVSAVRGDKINELAPSKLSDIFFGMPSVTFQERGDSPASSINIRGLQDFGRVAVVVDGARQNFQTTGHNANGVFFLDPELLAGADIVRGPVANIYGSGAIGGVASFRTKDARDVLRFNERWGTLSHAEVGSNTARFLGSEFVAARAGENVDLFAGGLYRKNANYQDGNGAIVPNTANETTAGIAKVTVRPAEFHEVKFTGITQDYDFRTGQFLGPAPATAESQYATNVTNQILTGRWKYSRPDDKLFDFESTVYWTRTNQDQLKVANGSATSKGNPITGFIGDSRNFNIETAGFDAHNTSRVETGPLRHAFTYGGDYFEDRVKVIDVTGTGDLFTPSGQREVYGAFLQWKASYSTWFEMINAARYDAFKLTDGTINNSGERISPKSTVGITPVKWFTVYGTYAEGYRAPAITETLVAGAHPPFANFPGAPPGFTFVPNPGLKPEVGRNKEIGINIRHDDLFTQGDRLRLKANVFRNDVEDYIDQVPFGTLNLFGIPRFLQYRNVANARIEGLEGEATYDAGAWFVGLSGQTLRGKNIDNGQPLGTVQPDQVAATAGVRFWDRKMTVSLRWAHVTAKVVGDIPDNDNNKVPDFNPTKSYNLVKFYFGYEPTPDILASFTADNLLNEQYTRYLDFLPSPGVTAKGSLKIRFGAT
jgi:hemoglobin/transferrin/lactoferrin receptor protein